MKLGAYYCDEPGMYVIPIEHLSATGISAAYATYLQDQLDVDSQWVELFNTAYHTYWQRAIALVAAMPRYWMPPRLQHCCIITDRHAIRPYFQPFNKSSWLFFQEDFDPALSHVEFATYLFFHMERMGVTQQVTTAIVQNLSYWLQRSEEEQQAFATACQRSPRPDAMGWQALGEAVSWVQALHHEQGRPPAPWRHDTVIPDTGLCVTPKEQRLVDRLVQVWARAANGAMQQYYQAYARRGKDRAGDVCLWLQEHVPLVVITGKDGAVLWDPNTPEDTRRLRRALGGLSASVAESLQADWQVIDRHSRRFLADVGGEFSLPVAHGHGEELSQNGLSYFHAERRLIAYNIHEPGMERLRVPAPPFERLMLGARTMHEWGHIAVDAGWVAVPASRQDEYAVLQTLLHEQYAQVVEASPVGVQRHCQQDLAQLAQQEGSIGAGLAQIVFRRLPDFPANVLARQYLDAAECETYIRNNVATLVFDFPTTALFRRLARYAYEVQYLRVSQVDDWWTYFVSSTWFADEYLRPGIVTEERYQEVCDTIWKMCQCFAVQDLGTQ